MAIIDELGRGTSTFDGYAIAHSVLQYLMQRIKCLTLFATHYHSLVEEFRSKREVMSYPMACRLNPETEEVTMLYKFIRGECPKSYGINVARLAGIPESVLRKAKEKSEQFSDKISMLTTNMEVMNFVEMKSAVEEDMEIIEEEN